MFGSLKQRSIILLYHRVARVERDTWSLCVTPEHFADHLEVLRQFRLVRLNEAAPRGWRFGGAPAIAITFDDGYADNLHQAAPILMRYDAPATFFIAAGYIGRRREFWWDELERIVFGSGLTESAAQREYASLYNRLQALPHHLRERELDERLSARKLTPEARESCRALTADELVDLASEDLFEIGAHTVTHPLLSAQSPAVQREEVLGSKRRLEALLDQPVTSFSYPYGGSQHYNAASVAAVRNAGFSRACTTAGRPITVDDDPFTWSRMVVTDMDGDQFRKLLLT